MLLGLIIEAQWILIVSPVPSSDPITFALSPPSPNLSFLGEIVLVICEESNWGGFVSAGMCLRRRQWKMRRVVAIHQHLRDTRRLFGRGSWGGAERDAEEVFFFFVWSWAWWNRCCFSSAASATRRRGWIRRGRGRGAERDFPPPAGSHFHMRASSTPHTHPPSHPPVFEGFLCSEEACTFPSFFSFPCNSHLCWRGKRWQNADGDEGNEQGEKVFHSPTMPSQLSSPLAPF